MRVYAPQISVKLVKAEVRKDLVDGLPVSAKRYGDFKAIDLTPYLSDGNGVQTTKSVREPAGGFTISLADKPIRGDMMKLETLYAFIEPMDLIEIRMCHDPSAYPNGQPPVVMRGFVSDVTRNEDISGQAAQRSVTIHGQDFGKILQILQIWFFNNSVLGDNILSELAFFHKYAGPGDAKIKTANEFIADVVKQVLNPYLKDLVALADGSSIGAKVVNEMEVAANVEGTVSPHTVASFQNVPLDQMLSGILDVGPFNEMFVEDTADGVRLVLRPNPFLDAKGNPIQGVKPEAIEIGMEDVVSVGLTRTDAGVANYYWVTDSRWMLMNNEDANMAAQMGPADDYILFEYLNAKASRYGIRKMEVQSALGDPAFSQSDAVTAEEIPEQVNILGDWLAKRRKILADSNKDNVLFENGPMTVRGNEKIKAGMQLILHRGNGFASQYYIVRVDHRFMPMRGFTSFLTLERGTNFITRSQPDAPFYFPEMAEKAK